MTLNHGNTLNMQWAKHYERGELLALPGGFPI
jgi:hypothetical protein